MQSNTVSCLLIYYDICTCTSTHLYLYIYRSTSTCPIAIKVEDRQWFQTRVLESGCLVQNLYLCDLEDMFPKPLSKLIFLYL